MDGDQTIGIKWLSVNLLWGIPVEQWHGCSAIYEQPIHCSPGNFWSVNKLKRPFIRDLKWNIWEMHSVSKLVWGSHFERCLCQKLLLTLLEKKKRKTLAKSCLRHLWSFPLTGHMLIKSYCFPSFKPQSVFLPCLPTVFLGVHTAVHDTTLSYLWLWLPGHWNNLVSPAHYKWHGSSLRLAFKVCLSSGWGNSTEQGFFFGGDVELRFGPS